MQDYLTSRVLSLKRKFPSLDLWIKSLIFGTAGYHIGKSVTTSSYLFIGIIGCLSLFFVPEFALLIICFFAIQISPTKYFKLFNAGSLDIYLWDPLILLLFIRLGISFLLGKRKLFSSPLDTWIIVLFAWGLISVIYSGNRFGQEHLQFTLVSLLRNFYFVLMFFLVSNLIDTKDRIRIFIKVVLFLVLFQVGLAVIQRIGAFTGITAFAHLFSPVKGAYGSINYRSIGTIGNPNLFGQAVILLSFPVLILFNSRSFSLLGWGLIALVLAGIIITGSRSAYIGSLVAFFLFFIQLEYKKIPRIILFVGLLGISFYFVRGYIMHRILSAFSVFDLSTMEYLFDPHSSLLTRFDIWQTKLSLSALSPVFGYGWSGSFPAYGRIYGTALYGDSHNQYIETLVDLGIPGLLIFIFLLAYILYLTWDLRNITDDPLFVQMSKALFVSFVGFYVSMFFVVTLETGNSVTGIFWALVGLAMAARRVALKNSNCVIET